jgi:tetratricopeptide (TPR) repeat protein
MRLRAADVLAACGALAVVGAVSWGAWVMLSPALRLDRNFIDSLVSAQKFDEAERVVEAYLKQQPDDSPARFLAAQMALDRPAPSEPVVRRALAHLQRVMPDSPRKAALVALYRGKAEFFLAQFDKAEKSWNEALRLDSTVPEAAWGLLELYYLQGRPADARRLALAQHAVEPDPADRVKFLLELVREDYKRIAPAALVQWFEPKVKQNPSDLHANLGLGRALVLDSKIDEGLALLRQAVAKHPNDPEAWDSLLSGLDDGGAPGDVLAEALGRLPKPLVDAPRFARHFGRVAQELRDWPAAIQQYRRAVAADPGDSRLRYRLARALRNAGQVEESERIDHQYQIAQAAAKDLKALYEEADSEKAIGTRPNPSLYRRLADLRERMGRLDEAAAWYRLVLRDQPDDPESLTALRRLGTP